MRECRPEKAQDQQIKVHTPGPEQPYTSFVTLRPKYIDLFIQTHANFEYLFNTLWGKRDCDE